MIIIIIIITTKIMAVVGLRATPQGPFLEPTPLRHSLIVRAW